MQNIEAILKQFGLEIPKEQAEEFRKTFHENYKTVKDYEKLETDRDTFPQHLFQVDHRNLQKELFRNRPLCCLLTREKMKRNHCHKINRRMGNHAPF